MFLVFNFGYLQDRDWFTDFDTVEYNETLPEIIMIRYIFFASIVVITIPLFLKRTMDDL